MIEPLLSVSIPNEMASLRKYHRAGGAEETVIVVEQAFGNVRCQENLAMVCLRCATQAGIRLLAVEGSDRKVVPSGSARSIRQYVREGSPVSAGVLALQQREPRLLDVWGVDDMELNRQSQAAMATVRQHEPMRDRAMTAIRPLLLAAQRKCYGDDLAALRRSTLMMYGERAEIGRLAALIRRSAAGQALEMRRFPFLRRYLDVQQREKKVSAWRLKLQAARFAMRMKKGMYGWFKRGGGNVINIDVRKVKPVLEYWMDTTGITPEELDERVAQRGLESTLRELKQWLDERFVVEARRQSADASYHVVYEEMMRFALRLGVNYFDLHHLREVIALRRDSATLTPLGLFDEMEVASREVVRKLGRAEALELMEIEDRLDLYWRALGLAVTPGDAETAAIAAGRIAPLLDALSRLAALPVPQSPDLRRIDEVLGDAAAFLRLSKQRSEHMARRTLALMRDRGEDRALLVVGGFHERAITRAFEDARRVSWSVVMPTPDLKEIAP
ncbi:MAG TPA: hypothetical protein VHL59_03240 [Thermoanaerobaculia bacterium]|nr:hypothetical protein [Thermoanaerobaculia bacterium]